MALSLSSTALLSIASSSCCCSHVLNPGFDGQSPLLTVTSHTPRNSRRIGGGLSLLCAPSDVEPRMLSIARAKNDLCMVIVRISRRRTLVPKLDYETA